MRGIRGLGDPGGRCETVMVKSSSIAGVVVASVRKTPKRCPAALAPPGSPDEEVLPDALLCVTAGELLKSRDADADDIDAIFATGILIIRLITRLRAFRITC